MKSQIQILLSLIAGLAAVTVASAADTTAARPDAPGKAYHYTVPENADDGWETASLSSVGLDADLMKDLFERVGDNTYKNIHSVLLVKDGKLVVEEYFPGRNSDGQYQVFQRDTLHMQQSVTKSVNSILIGIAIDQGLICGVEEKISTFFPEYSDLFAEGKKDAIQLKHCLSMTAGLSWIELGYPYTDPRNNAFGLNRSKDPVRYVLEKPVSTAPGKRFVYHSGISIVLGEILHNASGMLADEFAELHLFGPLGISDYYWAKLPNGSVHTGGGLLLRPRDMAKIGYLLLNGGRWQGKQIVSKDWIRESTKQQAPYRGYGYQWWLRTFRTRDRAIEAYAAQGLGGQFIIVVPDLQMVAVFTCWNVNALMEQPFEMLQQFVLPAADTR